MRTFFLCAALAATSGLAAQEAASVVAHPECTAFGSQRYTTMPPAVGVRSRLTERVTRQLPQAGSSMSMSPMGLTPIGGNSGSAQQSEQMGTVDKYIFQALQQAGVAPAPATTDYEFIRRVTLDLTGRIPTAATVTAFVNDTSTNKRATYIDTLLASPEWVDKWTMYYGDLYQNVNQTTQIRRGFQGRTALYNWIKTNLTANTPYNKMATALIANASSDTTLAQSNFTQGQINWLVGGVQSGTGIPVQDTIDQQAANVADVFLGVAHMNCLLCHNGAGHLTSLSLWGGQMTRYQAWGFAAFVARAQTRQSGSTNLGENWWYITNAATGNYNLNTTSGNRPARQPSGTPNNASTISPLYPFNQQTPMSGEEYRVALARLVTSDFQFARATVNYIWAEMFNMGIVDPPDTFDPLRLDPNNPPPSPWTLQPSNALLLNALTNDFIASGYDLKALMREIANSRTYQLSSRYNGTWNEAWEPLFARKLVRRLTAEEIHDAIGQSANMLTSCSISNQPTGGPVLGPFLYAMQYPDTDGTGCNGENTFLDDFLRGNRRDVFRSGDSSSIQALDLMNSTYVMNRVRASGSGSTATLLQQNINLTNNQMVNNLYLSVLSRNPTSTEMNLALTNLTGGVRATEAVNLMWTLFNKVDFIFNY